MNRITPGRTSIGLLALALLAFGCQPQTASTKEASTSERSAPARPPAAEQPLPIRFAAADVLSKSMQALLQKHDLATLWQGDNEERRTDPTLQGFFGPDHYRFALVLNEVQRDEQHPEVYHLRGKCRYRQNIRPFTGTLTVRQVVDLPDLQFRSVLAADEGLAGDTTAVATYTVRARLQLQEEQRENSGIFEGEALLDFYVVRTGKIGYVVSPMDGVDETNPTRGSGLLLRGKRRNVTTRQVKDFVVAASALSAAPDVFQDFAVGERGSEINPKYAKLGWNELWANEEWWHDSAKPQPNL